MKRSRARFFFFLGEALAILVRDARQQIARTTFVPKGISLVNVFIRKKRKQKSRDERFLDMKTIEIAGVELRIAFL